MDRRGVGCRAKQALVHLDENAQTRIWSPGFSKLRVGCHALASSLPISRQ